MPFAQPLNWPSSFLTAPRSLPPWKVSKQKYKLAIPPYYFSLIDVDDPLDPIGLQSLPSPLEQSSTAGVELEDPLEEDKDSPVPGLTHRYPDRVLLVTTHVCTMYCRFCTRKRVTMDRDGWDAPSHNDQRMVQYVRDHREIRDVIVSGGDPLSLPVGRLRWFVNELADIDHVDVIRLGTRVPVTLPQRLFDPDLIDMLKQAGKIWIQTHFNHPREITPSRGAGLPQPGQRRHAGQQPRGAAQGRERLGRHDAATGARAAADQGPALLPVPLRSGDRRRAFSHFGLEGTWKSSRACAGHVSGLAVPTYVVDGLHGAGKIPLMPNYLVSASDNAVVLRNYEGLLVSLCPGRSARGRRPRLSRRSASVRY